MLAQHIGPAALPGYDASDPAATARMREMSLAFVASDLRTAGSENDVLQYRTLGVEQWPLENMTVPTLILHGNADQNAPYEGSVTAAARIPNAKLVTFEGGEHTIIVSRAREIGGYIERFLVEATR